jgi:diguanylate cyclase (GGDEF)-like protein/PAS domain S-box-containing protein
MMADTLRVLLVEDSPFDAELIAIALENEGFRYSLTRVDAESTYLAELAANPDVILSDWRLPTFSGMRALHLLNESKLAIPFIIVSSVIGEELAVDALHEGAADYVLKDRLARLGTAVRRALESRRLREEHHRADADLRLAATVFESSAEGVVVTDPDGTILAVNRAFQEITGYGEADALGQNPRLLKSGRHDETFYRDMWASLLTTGRWRGELWNRRKSGEIYPEWATMSAVKGADGQTTHFVCVFSDLGDVRRAQDEADFLTHHDALTALPNRLLLLDRIDQALRRARDDAAPVAVVIVDLDRFGAVNDAFGHPFGDEVLKAVAERIGGHLGGGDSLARFGGDEFAIVLDDPSSASAVASEMLGLQELLARPFRIQDHEIVVTSTIGVSLFPEDGIDGNTLLMHAEAAVRQTKASGRGTIGFFDVRLAAQLEERLALERQLRGAVGRHEMLVYYQPQVSLSDGSLVGAEALVRWQHPERGLVLPGLFITLAEDLGIIGEIGRFVLDSVCQQVSDWDALGMRLPRVGVNLSAQQLDEPDLATSIRDRLAACGLGTDRLELELTESMVMRNSHQVMATLASLRSLGIELAMDDFGTGHSSLAQLQRLPLHRLKIDIAFVRDIGRNRASEEIIRATIAIAQNLGLETVAEGVELTEQADFLREAGCDVAQGYLYSRPLPAAAFLDLYGPTSG